MLACIASDAAAQTPEDRYGPRQVMAGSVSQMAKSARDAINCGFETVTVRPWKDGDGLRPHFPHPMVLIVKPPSNEEKMQAAYRCFDEKSGADMVIS